MGNGAKLEFGLRMVSFLLVVILSFSNVFIHPVDGKKCPGKCISNTTQCKLAGGKIAGYCTNQMACCDYSFKKIGSCGSNMTKLTTALFRSPSYPDYSGGDLICQFDFVLSPNASGIVVEFTEVTMDGAGFLKNSACESDIIYFKGFPDWTPPAQCGNLTSYAAVIDLGNRQTKGMTTFTILAIMSSMKYKWNIKLTQLYLERKSTSPFRSNDEGPAPIDYTDSEEYSDDDDDLASVTSAPFLTQSKKIDVYDHHDGESEEEEIARLIQLSKLKYGRTPSITSLSNVNTLLPEGEDYNDGIEEEPFIVNGEDTEISAVPWQASLRTLVSPRVAKLLPELGLENCTLEEGLHFCGGSVISDRHILSATHCFLLGVKLSMWQRISNMKVILGDSNTCDESKDGVQEFHVNKVYFHYAYDTQVILNDLVVIKLKEKIQFNDKVKPIKLASEGMTFEHRTALASGWGLTNLTVEEKNTADQLQFASDLLIGNRSYCSKEQKKLFPSSKRSQLIRYPKYKDVFSSLLCTHLKNGSIARLVGQGDSGGPLVVYPENSTESGGKPDPLLVGVISYMIPIPHSKKPHDVSLYVDFYQSVSYYRKWIELAMQ